MNVFFVFGLFSFRSFPFEDQQDFAAVEGNHPDEAGAILVFLPGMGEIRRLTTVLRREFRQVRGDGVWMFPFGGRGLQRRVREMWGDACQRRP